MTCRWCHVKDGHQKSCPVPLWQRWGAKGGQSTSTAKVTAARQNGQRGGRPKEKEQS